MTDERRGVAAERLAAWKLADSGYEVIASNYRARPGEIDLIALKDDLIVFIEVKQRTGSRYGRAVEAVDGRKIGRILATADVFLSENPGYADRIWRLDLIAITLNRDGSIADFKHVENLVVD